MKKKKHGFLKFLIILVILGVIFYFVNDKFDLVSKIKDVGSTVEKEKEEEKPIPKLQIVDEGSNSRVIAVMINNSHRAWPHSGLQDAFLNYEIIVEGGITRIMSLFKDKNTERIGSVRSARHYYLDYAMENDAVYVHFGHSPQALSDISKYGIDNINGIYSSGLYWRDKSLNKASEHTAFTSMERINDLIGSKGYRNTSEERMLLNYTTDEVDLKRMENSIKADTVFIDYSSYTNTTYEYDKNTKLYERTMDGTPHTDYITGLQYTTKNIITYQVKNKSIDSTGRQNLENTGTGSGYYITNGYAVPITWEKTSRESKTIYKYENGNEIDVSDGVTWIQIQPVGKELSIEGAEENSSNTN